MKRLILVAMMAAGLAFAPRAAQAATIIDFGTGSTAASGAIVTSGGVITSASGIALGIMTFNLTAIWDTLGTGISSTTDAFRSALNGSAVLSFNVAAGTFQINGGIGCLDTSLVSCTTVASTTPLISGTLLSFTQTGTSSISFIGGNVVLASAFATAFGINTVPWTVHSAFVINNSGQTVSSDVNITEVPEPGSMILLGSGLLGLAALARRRMRRA